MDTDQYYELNSIDGELVVFEWKIFPWAQATEAHHFFSHPGPRTDQYSLKKTFGVFGNI